MATPSKHKRWRFFRVKTADELQQIGFKGPFTVHGKKCRFLVCIDDYSRFLVMAEHFSHEPKTMEVTALLGRQKTLPKVILSNPASSSRSNGKDGADSMG